MGASVNASAGASACPSVDTVASAMGLELCSARSEGACGGGVARRGIDAAFPCPSTGEGTDRHIAEAKFLHVHEAFQEVHLREAGGKYGGERVGML